MRKAQELNSNSEKLKTPRYPQSLYTKVDKNPMKRFCCVLAISFTLLFAQSSMVQRINSIQEEFRPAQKIELPGFKNLYKIDDSLYRSEQPSKKGMMQLKQLGIKTVLNFRNHHSDKNEVSKVQLNIERLALNTNKITYADIVQTLRVMQHAKKPILIHCLHGADRTGCMIAAYRMVYNNYTKEQAIAELTAPEFGYHQTWFPNIIELLNGLDVEQLKRELK